MNLGTHIHRRLLADDEPLPVLEAPVGPDRIEALVRAADPLLPPADVRRVVRTVSASVEGLGPVAPLFADPAVTDVLVNGPGPVWVERAGVLEPAGIALDRAQVDLLVERILGPLGRRVDPVSPVADARLADGSRVHVVVPPLAVDGPYVTVRRFRRRPIALADLAAAPVARLLREAVGSRANIVISGAPGRARPPCSTPWPARSAGPNGSSPWRTPPSCGCRRITSSASRPGPGRSRGWRASTCASWSATRSGCDPTAWSWARSAAARRSTSSRP